MGGSDSVGSLLADIANLVLEGLRILGPLADKRQWTQDEHELQRAMERTLNDAKCDFQELSSMLKSQSHYEHDRSFASIQELVALRASFSAHTQNLREWSRAGGPVDAVWVRDTKRLGRELHRAQRRAAQRIFDSAREMARHHRCLGALVVHRKQRTWSAARSVGATSDHDCCRRQRDELDECRAIGVFERFGGDGWAFICDFCDGHLLWEDLETLPTTRAGADDTTALMTTLTPTTSPTQGMGGALLPMTTIPSSQDPWLAAQTALSAWQANGRTVSANSREAGEETKQVVYPPLAVASHLAPNPGDWLARLLCPLCEEAATATEAQDVDDEEHIDRPDSLRFDDLTALQEHLEWEHAGPSSSSAASFLPGQGKCVVM